MIDPSRYRERLIQSLSEDGLEELTLRLARPEYPDAHRTGRGADSGIDVLSDYDVPAARAWQAKNYVGERIKWDSCRDSLRRAMESDAQPRRYTFVFPRRLRTGERDFWRDEFLPGARERYPALEELDYWDDLAERIEKRPDLVDQLNDGAFGVYMREVLAQTAETGVNPLATAPDLADGLTGVATQAKAAGRNDPRFAYGFAGREASARDDGIPDKRVRISLEHGVRDALPRYALTLRDGDLVREVTAEPKPGVEVSAPEPWFAPGQAGDDARFRARIALAKGRAIELTGDEVGLLARDVPDAFRGYVRDDGVLRRGTLELGVSAPLVLTISFRMPGGTVLRQQLAVHRVPALAGDAIAYAGALGGVIVALNLHSVSEPGDGTTVFDTSVEILLAVEHERPAEVAAGLGFANAFGACESLRFDCPGLFPVGGIDSAEGLVQSLGNEEALEAAALVALALAELERRDGVERDLPAEVSDVDRAVAELVLKLLTTGGVRAPFTDEIVTQAAPGAEPGPAAQSAAEFRSPVPDLCRQPTGLVVERSLENADAAEVFVRDDGAIQVRCRARDGGGALVMLLVDD